MPKVGSNSLYRYFLGVDPGTSGGFALLREDAAVTTVRPMPGTEKDIFDTLCELTHALSVTTVIERVGGFVPDRGNPDGPKFMGASMFKFGMSYGGLRMALVALGVRFTEVTPQKWQGGVGVAKRKKGESRTSFKNRLKARAQQLFPQEKVTLAVADSLLIAEYCRLQSLVVNAVNAG